MYKNIMIKGFDPTTMNLLDYVSPSEMRHVDKYLKEGLLLPPARVFRDDNEIAKIYNFIKMFDPTLAIVCMLSYKYALHPIYSAGVIRGNKYGELVVGGYDLNFSTRRFTPDDHDKEAFGWYIKQFRQNDFLFAIDRVDFVNEYKTRWAAVKERMNMAGIDSEGISLASFYSTRIHEIVNDTMDVRYVSKLLDIPSLTITNLLLVSSGLELNWSIITENYCPDNPFLHDDLL